MKTKPRILAIDDDAGLRSLIRATLGDSYEVEQCIDGPSGLASASRCPPDLILLDITMPGQSGYEVCRALRREEGSRQVPVIFLSALSRLDDRLLAYDAGGDDFLGKPFDPVELTDKVEVTLRRVAERRRLLAEKDSAFATAMTALSVNGEIGAVLGFLHHSFACRSYATLADALIDTAAAWGLTLSVQLRGSAGEISRNRAGDSHPLEAGVLGTLADCGRLAALGRRLAVNYPQVTLMAVDMPVAEPERDGRLRDALAWLAEAADARVRALDNELALGAQREALQRLVERTGAALGEIEQRRRLQKAAAVMLMQDMLLEMERSFLPLGLSDEQEVGLNDILHGAVDKVIELFDQGLATDAHLQAITADLARAGQ